MFAESLGSESGWTWCLHLLLSMGIPLLSVQRTKPYVCLMGVEEAIEVDNSSVRQTMLKEFSLLGPVFLPGLNEILELVFSNLKKTTLCSSIPEQSHEILVKIAQQSVTSKLFETLTTEWNVHDVTCRLEHSSFSLVTLLKAIIFLYGTSLSFKMFSSSRSEEFPNPTFCVIFPRGVSIFSRKKKFLLAFASVKGSSWSFPSPRWIYFIVSRR